MRLDALFVNPRCFAKIESYSRFEVPHIEEPWCACLTISSYIIVMPWILMNIKMNSSNIMLIRRDDDRSSYRWCYKTPLLFEWWKIMNQPIWLYDKDSLALDIIYN